MRDAAAAHTPKLDDPSTSLPLSQPNQLLRPPRAAPGTAKRKKGCNPGVHLIRSGLAESGKIRGACFGIRRGLVRGSGGGRTRGCSGAEAGAAGLGRRGPRCLVTRRGSSSMATHA